MIAPHRRPKAPLALAASLLALCACASTNSDIWDAIESGAAPAAAQERASIELPASAAPRPPMANLEFLAGRWIAVNPNGTVNEEVWTPPRGNVAVGTFRQVRKDGNCAFVELSQISLEDDELVLRLRHLHGRLEVPEGRAEVSLFRLVSLEPNRVEFAGTESAAGVTSVVYERTADAELLQSIGFSPESGETPFVTRYVLDGR